MRITCQFREGRAMVYDLKAGECRWEVRIEAQATPAAPWTVTVVVKRDGRTCHAVGPTRLLALDELERTSDVLAHEEWVGLRHALGEVRALESRST